VSPFTPDLFSFLTDLKRNNTREWVAANRDRYVRSVETPMLEFITQVGERLPAVSPAFRAVARRMGGSLYRLQRDTRFSPDKSPYKTWVAAIFRHRSARGGHGLPAFYLHLDPAHSFGGGGSYRPDQPTLTRIRRFIVEHEKEWRAVRETAAPIQGERLLRVPAGFPRTHPLAEDLKLKDFYTGVTFTGDDVVARDFLDRYMRAIAEAAPVARFLTRALDLAW
jgi:uncharacterized protein (TIGR02453 family)